MGNKIYVEQILATVSFNHTKKEEQTLFMKLY